MSQEAESTIGITPRRYYNGITEARWLDGTRHQHAKRGNWENLSIEIQAALKAGHKVELFNVDQDGECDLECFQSWPKRDHRIAARTIPIGVIRERLREHTQKLVRLAGSAERGNH